MRRFILAATIIFGLGLLALFAVASADNTPRPQPMNEPAFAVTPIAVQSITIGTPITPTFTSVQSTTGNSFVNNGHTFLNFKNSQAASTCTIVTPLTVGGLDVADKTVYVPATTGDVILGPFLPELYNSSSGVATLTCSPAFGVTAAVLSYP